jgi:hypothetical protein
MAELVVVFPPNLSFGAQPMLHLQCILLHRLFIIATPRFSILFQLGNDVVSSTASLRRLRVVKRACRGCIPYTLAYLQQYQRSSRLYMDLVNWKPTSLLGVSKTFVIGGLARPPYFFVLCLRDTFVWFLLLDTPPNRSQALQILARWPAILRPRSSTRWHLGLSDISWGGPSSCRQ